jgi:hypothetical protein
MTLYKEQRADLLPLLLQVVNEALIQPFETKPITVGELQRYYREDAFVWRFYLALCKVDRRLLELRGRPYHFTLPGLVQR